LCFCGGLSVYTDDSFAGVGCQATDIDVSPAAFDKIAPRASGRVHVTWAWLSPRATG
jgi:expansin (peptidoglycan-binding protein)